MTNLTAETDGGLSISKELPASDEHKVKKFKEAIKPLLEGISGIRIGVNAKLGPGDPYRTIEKVVPLKGEEPMDILHKEGEVWLIDFWATWCGYCHAPMSHNADMV